MPEITREEAKQAIAEWIEHHVFARDAFTGHEKFHDRYEAILRLALAALEDAERLQHLIDMAGASVDAMEDSVMLLVDADVEWSGDGIRQAIDTDRAAIDRARGK